LGKTKIAVSIIVFPKSLGRLPRDGQENGERAEGAAKAGSSFLFLPDSGSVTMKTRPH